MPDYTTPIDSSKTAPAWSETEATDSNSDSADAIKDLIIEAVAYAVMGEIDDYDDDNKKSSLQRIVTNFDEAWAALDDDLIWKRLMLLLHACEYQFGREY